MSERIVGFMLVVLNQVDGIPSGSTSSKYN